MMTEPEEYVRAKNDPDAIDDEEGDEDNIPILRWINICISKIGGVGRFLFLMKLKIDFHNDRLLSCGHIEIEIGLPSIGYRRLSILASASRIEVHSGECRSIG